MRKRSQKRWLLPARARSAAAAAVRSRPAAKALACIRRRKLWAAAIAILVLIAAAALLWPGSPLQQLLASLQPAAPSSRTVPASFGVNASAGFLSDSSQANFNSGTFNQTHANSSSYLKLNWTDFSTNLTVNATGNFSSRVLDANVTASWPSLNWSSPWNASGQVRNDTFNTTGLVGLWHFNNESQGEYNGSHFQDNGTAGRNASCLGALCPTFSANGRLKGNLNFDGSNDYVTTPDSSAYSLVTTNQLSVCAWARVSDTPSAGDKQYGLVSKGTNSQYEYTLYWGPYQGAGNKVNVIFWTNPGSSLLNLDGSTNLSTATWYQLCFTAVNGSTVNLYVNGALDGTSSSWSPGATTDRTAPLDFGHRGDNNSNSNLAGSLDEVSVWNRTLSADEIAQLYAMGAARIGVQVRSCNDSSCAGENWTGPDGDEGALLSTFNNTVEIPSASDNTTNLKVLYHLNNQTVGEYSGTNFEDFSGSGFNGSCSGATCPTISANGRMRGTYAWDGTNDFVDIGASDPIATTDTVTFGGWVKPGTGNNYAFGRGRDGSGSGWSLYLYAGSNGAAQTAVVTDTPSTAGYTAKGTTVLRADTWHHVMAVWVPGSGISLYVDGVHQKTASTTSTNLRTSTVGSRLGRVNDLYYNGSIDEFAIWTRALSATEIYNLYKNGADKHDNSWTESPIALNTTYAPNNRYLQYKLNLSTGNTSNTSWLTGVSAAFDTTPLVWNSGTFNQTHANSSGFLKLNWTDFSTNLTVNATGNYSTQVFDAIGQARWNSTNWSSPWNASGQIRNDTFNTTGLVGLWHFNNESSGEYNGSHFFDNSTLPETLRNNGTCSGTTCPEFNASGKLKGAYTFDGANDYVEIVNSSVLNVTGAITVAFWGRTPSADSVALAKRDTPPEIEWGIRYAGSVEGYVAKFSVYTGSWTQAIGTTALNDNTWHHVVGVFNTTNILIYVDGLQEGINTLSSLPSLANGLYIGKRGVTDSLYFNGSIDEVAIFNRSLSAAEVSQLYAMGAAKLGLQARSCDDSACAGEQWAGPAGNGSVEIPSPAFPSFTYQNTTGLGSADNTTNLRGLWHLNNQTVGEYSGTNFEDFSGSGNNGSCTEDSNFGCPAINTSGKFRGAYTFNGTQDSILLASSTNLDLNGNVNFTLAVWAKAAGPEYPTGNSALAGKWASSAGYMLYVGSATGKIQTYVNSGGNAFADNAFPNDGKWHHVVGTKQGTTGAVYVDGILKNSSTVDASITSNIVKFEIGTYNSGCCYVTGKGYFNGSIDEVAVWNRSLSSAEIQQLYLHGAPTYFTDSPAALNSNLTPDSRYAQVLLNLSTDNTSNSSWAQGLTVNYDPDPTFLVSCQDITSNGTYTLAQNISSTNYCLNVTQSNVTIDLAGYWISFGSANNASYGVWGKNVTNVTVKNGYINLTGRPAGQSAPVLFQNSSGLTFFNLSLGYITQVSSVAGMVFNGSVNNTNVTNVTIHAYAEAGSPNIFQIGEQIGSTGQTAESPLRNYTNWTIEYLNLTRTLLADHSKSANSFTTLFRVSGRASNLTIRQLFAEGGSNGQTLYVFGAVTNLTLEDSLIGPPGGNNGFVAFGSTVNPSSGMAGAIDGLMLRNNRLTNLTTANTCGSSPSGGFGITGWPMKNVVIENNTLTNCNWPSGVSLYLWVSTAKAGPAGNITIRNNTIYHGVQSYHALNTAAVSITLNATVAIGSVQNVTIEGNNLTMSILNNTAYRYRGVAVSCTANTAWPSAAQLVDWTIANNTLFSPSMGSGEGIRIEQCVNQTQGFVVHSNNISGGRNDVVVINTTNVTFINNTFFRYAHVWTALPYTDLALENASIHIYNSTFNATVNWSANGAPAGSRSNITEWWPARVNVTDATFNPLSSLPLNVSNATYPSTQNYTGASTDSAGLTPWFWAPNLTANSTSQSVALASNVLANWSFPNASWTGNSTWVANWTNLTTNATTVLMLEPSCAAWNNGSFNGTVANASCYLLLGRGAAAAYGSAGNFSSPIADAVNTTTLWTFLNWSSPWNASGQIRNDTFNASNLTLLLHFNNESALESNGSFFLDNSTMGWNGTSPNSSASPTFNASGRLKGAVTFDGFDDYISIGDLPAGITPPSAITLSAWVKHNSDSFKSWEAILAKGDGSYRMHFCGTGAVCANGSTTNAFAFALSGPTGTADLGSTVIPTTGRWYHVVGTYDGATQSLYIDGTLVATQARTGSINGNGYNLWIGNNQEQRSRYLNGSLDEVTIFNRSLSAQEVANLYALGAAKLGLQARSCDDSACAGEQWAGPAGNGSVEIPSPAFPAFSANSVNGLGAADNTTGLVGLWHLNNQTVGEYNGSHFEDFSGAGNNGSSQNSSTTPTFNSSGKLRGGLTFDGTDDFVNISNATLGPAFDGAYAVTYWMLSGSSTTALRPWTIERPATGFHASIFNYPSVGRVKFYSGSGADATALDSAATNLNNAAWRHYAFVDNVTHILLYVDGNLDNSTTRPTNTSGGNTNLIIGNRGSLGGVYLAGSLDEVAIWNRSLSSAEIQQLYLHGAPTYFTDSPAALNSNLAPNNRYGQMLANLSTDNTSNTPWAAGLTMDYDPDPAYLVSCQDITSNGTYTLTQNLSSTNYCINITQSNVTLDLAGYWVSFGSTDNASYGVWGKNVTNVTVKNGYINLTGRPAGSSAPVYFTNSSTLTFFNLSIGLIPNSGNTLAGMLFSGSVNNTNVTNITIYAPADGGNIGHFRIGGDLTNLDATQSDEPAPRKNYTNWTVEYLNITGAYIMDRSIAGSTGGPRISLRGKTSNVTIRNFYAERTGNSIIEVYGNSSNITLENSVFPPTAGNNGMVRINTQPNRVGGAAVDGLMVRNNRIVNVFSDCSEGNPSTAIGIDAFPVNNVVFENNTITGCNWPTGINLYLWSNVAKSGTSGNITFRNNTVSPGSSTTTNLDARALVLSFDPAVSGSIADVRVEQNSFTTSALNSSTPGYRYRSLVVSCAAAAGTTLQNWVIANNTLFAPSPRHGEGLVIQQCVNQTQGFVVHSNNLSGSRNDLVVVNTTNLTFINNTFFRYAHVNQTIPYTDIALENASIHIFNSTFNATVNWSANKAPAESRSNITDWWPARVNVTDATFNALSGAPLNISNATYPSTQNYTGAITDSSGLTPWFWAPNLTANNTAQAVGLLSNVLANWSFPNASWTGNSTWVANWTNLTTNATTVLMLGPSCAAWNNGVFNGTVANASCYLTLGRGAAAAYGSAGNFSSAPADAVNTTISWNFLNWSSPWNASGQVRNDTFNTTGLVGLWHFNNESSNEYNGSFFNDNSTLGYNGNCTGTGCPTINASGRFKGGYFFDGSNDVISVPSSLNNVLSSTTITVSVWVYSAVSTFSSANKGIIDEAFIGDNRVRFAIAGQLDGGCASTQIGSGFYDGSWHTACSNFAGGQWEHFVGTYDGSTVRIYRDGVLTGTTSYTGSMSGTEEWRIGQRWDLADYFSGSIDEVAVFNRTLSAQEVANLYALGAAKLGLQARSCDDSACAGEPWQGPAGNGSVEIPSPAFPSFTYQNTTGLGAADNATGLVLLMHLNNQTVGEYNGSHFEDFSSLPAGTKNNGSCSGTSCPAVNTTGKIRGAMTFDGVNDYVDVANEANFDFERTNSFTLSAWVKPSVTSNWEAIIGKSTLSNNYRGIRFVTQTGGELRIDMVSNWDINVLRETTTNANIDDGNWHHVATTYNGSSSSSGLKFYVDGGEKSTTIDYDTLSATVLTDVTLKIGASNAGTGDSIANAFNGSIDEVAIWNRTLSSAEIQQLYLHGAPTYFTDSPAALNSNLAPNNRYGQMLANLSTDNTSNTPWLANWTENWSAGGSDAGKQLNVTAFSVADTLAAGAINFTFKAWSNTTLNKATLFTNETGTWQSRSTANATILTNDTLTGIPYTPSRGGIILWNIVANDTAGFQNQSMVNQTFAYDPVGPNVTLWSPNQNSTARSNSTIALNASCFADFLSTCSMTAMRNGTGMATSGQITGNATYNLSFSLAEGTNALWVNSSDALGQRGTNSSTVFVVLDTVAPTVSIGYPVSGGNYSVDPVLSATSADAAPSSGITCSWSLNSGANNSYTCNTGPTITGSSAGQNKLEVYDTDAAGNPGGAAVFYNSRTGPPDPKFVTITPASNYTNGTNVTLNVSVEENVTSATLEVNGTANVTMNLTNSTIANATVALGLGNNTFRAYVNTSFNTTNSTELRWYWQDPAPPSASSPYPVQDGNYSSGPTPKFAQTDASSGVSTCWHSLNGANTTVACDNTSALSSSAGQNLFYACANDKAANLACTAQIAYNYQTDANDPVFISPTPANKTYSSLATFTINMSAARNITSATFQNDTTNYSMTLTNATLATVTLEPTEGNHTYRAYTNDSFNLPNATEQRLLIRDVTSPVSRIFFPQETTYYAPPNITVASFDLNHANNATYSLNGAANTTFSNGSELTSAEGANTLLVNVWDEAGNFNWSQISYTYLPPPKLNFFGLNLTVNRTVNNVAVPGSFAGPVNASTLFTKLVSNHTFNFLTSYLGEPQAALVSSVASATTLFLANTSGNHTIGLNQSANNLTSTQLFLVFTRGDQRSIQEQMERVKARSFLSAITPSFGYGLGAAAPLKLLLNYTDVNVVSNLTLGKGASRLVITNTGEADDRQNVTVERG